MQVLTIASQKGGTGKTTLSAHLAVEAELAGAGPVAVVDTDPQGSLAAWWNTRVADTPLFAAVNIAQIQEHLALLREQGINLVIIDTAPQRIDERALGGVPDPAGCHAACLPHGRDVVPTRFLG